MPIGNYKIVVDSVPAGHVLVEPTDMVVKDTTNTQHYKVNIPTIIIEVIAVDKTTGKPITRVKVDISTYTGSIIEEGASIRYEKERMPAGQYTLHVVQGPSGYVAPEDVDIDVKSISEMQTFIIEMDHTRIQVVAINKETREEIPSGVVVDIVNKSGVALAQNVPLEYLKEYVPSGDYTVVIKKIPTGYIMPDDPTIKVLQTADLQRFEIELAPVRIAIRPKDANTHKVVKGVTLVLRNTNGKVYGKWVSGKGWKFFDPINPGEYLLEAIKVPKGYEQPEIMPITVESVENMQYFEMPLTKKTSKSCGGPGSSSASSGGPGSSSGSPSAGSPASGPKTGDNTPILGFSLLALMSGLLVVLLMVIRRRRRVR